MNRNAGIKFGTDGWRGIIAEDFTFENVRRVSKAIALYLKQKVSNNPKVIVGYDTRFNSVAFAQLSSEVLSSYGCSVVLSDKFLSTPAVSSNVVDLDADGGVVISASHNPPLFCGIKFKTMEGCSAPEDITKTIEGYIDKEAGPAKKKGKIEKRKLLGNYFKRLRSSVNIGQIRKKRLKVVVDPMCGASVDYMDALLKESKCKVISIHNNPDPLFAGLHPEPIRDEVSELISTVRRNSANIGLATDGDADRVGVVDETGRYYPPHLVFPLLLYYLCHYKKKKGKVVQTISLGYISERIAKDYNLDFEEVPVGFKYIAERILSQNILIGGEESGGYGYGNYLPERDGILNSLMFLEMLSYLEKPLSAILREIEKRYGTSCFLRTDFPKLKGSAWTKNEFVENLKSRTPDKIADLKVKQVKDYDGIEFILQDDSWLLLRPSGTEPIIRVYSESPTLEQTKKIISWGYKQIKTS